MYEIKRVSNDELMRNSDALVDICMESFGTGMTREEVLEHLTCNVGFIAYKDGTPVGFAAMEYNQEEPYLINEEVRNNVEGMGHSVDKKPKTYLAVGAYLSAAFVKNSEQGNGLYKRLTEARINSALEMMDHLCNISCGDTVKSMYISTRTQNPRVEEGISNALAELKADGTIASYSISRDTIRGIYGRMLTATRPFSQNDVVNAAYDVLDYDRGDALLLRFDVQLP